MYLRLARYAISGSSPDWHHTGQPCLKGLFCMYKQALVLMCRHKYRHIGTDQQKWGNEEGEI